MAQYYDRIPEPKTVMHMFRTFLSVTVLLLMVFRYADAENLKQLETKSVGEARAGCLERLTTKPSQSTEMYGNWCVKKSKTIVWAYSYASEWRTGSKTRPIIIAKCQSKGTQAFIAWNTDIMLIGVVTPTERHTIARRHRSAARGTNSQSGLVFPNRDSLKTGIEYRAQRAAP